jgi:hypothetical protein
LDKCKHDRDMLPEPISLTLEEAMQVTGGVSPGLAVTATAGTAVKTPIVIWGIPAPEWNPLSGTATQVNAVQVG